MSLCTQVVNICVWVLASAFGVPAMVLGNVEEEQEHNSKYTYMYLHTYGRYVCPDLYVTQTVYICIHSAPPHVFVWIFMPS